MKSTGFITHRPQAECLSDMLSGPGDGRNPKV